MLEQAEAALAERDNARAEAALLAALELAPGREDALFSLHRLLRQDGKIGAAEAILRRMVAVNPNNFAPTNELTLMLLARGALAEAEVHARNAVRIAPRSAQAHNLMGLVMTEANRALIGEYHYREVLRLLERDDAVTLANLAWNLKTQGRIEEARQLYTTSVAANPGVLQSVLGWARTEEADRKFDRALELVEQAEAIAPGNQAVALTRATILARKGATEDALTRLDRLGEGSTLGPAELSEKGRLLDRLGRYDEAFAAYQAGKTRALELGAPTGYRGRAARVFHRTAARHTAPRHHAHRHAAADLHRRLSALRHHADRTDPVGAQPHRRRRRATLYQRCHASGAKAVRQPPHLPRCALRIMDGRSTRRTRPAARSLPRPGAPSRHSA
ncbi:MAG: hypothetical protein B7Z71_13840 [Acidocella sp. 21-58-7]|nr:MAG: hypothetical protein B7Z71_13840 [Acidocella sp. 21-58-7]